MKRLLVLAVIFASALFASGAGATPHPVNGTLNATITSGVGWCCGSSVDFQGQGSVAGLGKTSFTGNYTHGEIISGPDFHFLKVLDVTLTTMSGDTIELRADINWYTGEPEPSFTWTVTQATGRFAGYTGSGLFEVIDDDGLSVVFTISGNLTS